MKNVIYSIFALFSILSISSCKKYLDQQPPDVMQSTDVVFSNYDNALKAVIGAYAELAGDQGYGKVLSMYYSVDNDETAGSNGTQDDRRALAHYALTPSNTEILNPWNNMYSGIERCNNCCYYIPKMKDFNTDKRLQRLYGEALTLRAQFYFELVRNWGDVPESYTPSALVKDLFLPRQNRTIIFDNLLNQLTTAIQYLPWANEVTSIGDNINERVTKGTAKALRARIALHQAGWFLNAKTKVMDRVANPNNYYLIARDECKDIIQSGVHSLNPSFKDLWQKQVCGKVVTDPNNELMFQITTVPGSSANADSKLGFYNGPKVNGFGNGGITVLPNYFYLFDSNDLRRDVTCAPYASIVTQINGVDSLVKQAIGLRSIVEGKYRRDWLTDVSFTDATQYLGLKWQLIRYSDVLLMFAEADNEVNGSPSNDAMNAINMVRRRGFGKSINSADPTVDVPAGLSKQDFFVAIVKERSFELAGEGVRKHDLIRWNLLNRRINEVKQHLNDMYSDNGGTDFYGTYPYQYKDGSTYSVYPKAMYYYKNSTADDKNIWSNSLYVREPSSTPPNSVKISSWRGSTLVTSLLNPASGYANGYQYQKGELLPIPQQVIDVNYNITYQNPGY